MKNFQLVVNLWPDDVMRRLAASIDPPKVIGSLVPFGGKDFYGQLTGYEFWVRKRQRMSGSKFAPACGGSVIPNGSGSTINYKIGAKYTFFWIFGAIFLVFSLFFALIVGLLGLVGKLWIVVGVAVLIPIVVIAFLGGIFGLGLLMGKGDETTLNLFMENLFRDAIVKPATRSPYG